MTSGGRFPLHRGISPSILAALACFAAFPISSLAQPAVGRWRIAIVASRHPPESLERDGQWGALLRGLRDLGYIEGRNLALEWRFADGHYQRLPELAAELLRVHPDVIVTDGTPATRATQKATATIPIVFANASDPVENGLVQSLPQPGGNTTGISNLQDDTSSKQLEMLTSVVPKLSRVAVLLNPSNPTHVRALKTFEAAARKRTVRAVPIELRSADEVDRAFGLMTGEGVEALLVMPDPLFYELHRRFAALAIEHRLPSVAMNPEWAEAGILMTYGQNVPDNYRRIATYIDKIFKGAKPRDLPVEQPTRLVLVLNRKTARALAIDFPPELLLQADTVIE